MAHTGYAVSRRLQVLGSPFADNEKCMMMHGYWVRFLEPHRLCGERSMFLLVRKRSSQFVDDINIEANEPNFAEVAE